MNERELYKYEFKILMARIKSHKGSLSVVSDSWKIQVCEYSFQINGDVFEYELDYATLRSANDFITEKFGVQLLSSSLVVKHSTVNAVTEGSIPSCSAL